MWSRDVPQKKLGPIGSAVFDVYWIQTNRQTDKPNLYIDIARISVEKVDRGSTQQVS